MIKYLLISAALLLFAAALWCPLVVRDYTFKTKKLHGHIRIIQISDLHCTLYGRNQKRLIGKIEALEPDAICYTGDIFDDRVPYENAMTLLKGLKRYPCYFVNGNHEIYIEEIESVLTDIKKLGINILDGNGRILSVRGEKAHIYGVSDPIKEQRKPENYAGKSFNARLKDCKPNMEELSVLLSHRPEHIGDYAAEGFDIVLCGHAHGGQWRLPPLINGVYSPHQGLFPKYAGGIYRKGNTTEIVSRGLSKIILIPRLFNPVEIVEINITGGSQR